MREAGTFVKTLRLAQLESCDETANSLVYIVVSASQQAAPGYLWIRRTSGARFVPEKNNKLSLLSEMQTVHLLARFAKGFDLACSPALHSGQEHVYMYNCSLEQSGTGKLHGSCHVSDESETRASIEQI